MNFKLRHYPEAYFIDFPKPIKERMPQANLIEANLHDCISVAFGVYEVMPPIVKEEDKKLCEIEKRVLRGDEGKINIPPHDPFQCWTPNVAKEKFLLEHWRLMAHPNCPSMVKLAALHEQP